MTIPLELVDSLYLYAAFNIKCYLVLLLCLCLIICYLVLLCTHLLSVTSLEQGPCFGNI